MKKITILILFLYSNFFAQDLFFEQIDGTDTTYGTIDVLKSQSNSFESGVFNNLNFDKTLGWQLSAVDGANYYYQITDTSSDDYGAIAYWDALAEQVVDYGQMSDIFESPTNWFLGGADDGVLYFASNDTDSQIVSWDGTSLTEVNYMSDMVVAIQNWRFCGYHEGVVYLQWTRTDSVLQRIYAKGWDGSTFINTFNFNNYYTHYTDANVFGVSTYILTDDSQIISALEQVKSYINDEITLTVDDLLNLQNELLDNASFFGYDYEVIELAQEIIALYDTKYGALFTTGTTTEGGYSRADSGFEFENLILDVMQYTLDAAYSKENLDEYPELFEDVVYKTSSFFPGSVTPPSDVSESYTVKINGTHVRNWGTPANYESMDARRPTGCYLAPGSIAEVTVPSSLVGIGASVLVGAHTWDLTRKATIKRMDRVTKVYDITNETIKIANPLGGGIYINIPFQYDLGDLDVTLTNVVRSPYFANTVTNQTSVSDWQSFERNHDVPWTDFETDKVMFQIPTSWIYNLDDPSVALDDWDLSMDAISEMLGRPLLRSKTVLYAQVDVIARGSANFPGYPQSNVSYNPYLDYGGAHDHYLINGPRNERGYLINTLFHEQGHAEKIYKFDGEVEAFVNFLWVAVYNKKFGIEINQAFSESFTGFGISHTIEEAAISWMIAQNFREGSEMSKTGGQFRQEFSYQYRGYAKYADLVRLFDWQAIDDFYFDLNTRYENGTYSYTGNVNYVPADDRILRMSQITGYDLRPLIHFWGVHPDDFAGLATLIEDSGVEQSTAIYDLLMFYKTIVPKDNTSFRNFGLQDFSETKINNSSPYDHVSQSYYEGFMKMWWDEYDSEEGLAAVNEIQNIIDLYFPEGRPEMDNDSCYEIDILAAEASSYEAGSTNDAGNAIDDDVSTRWAASGDGEYIVFDLGEEYFICDMQLDFYENASRSYTFDVEVSRDNLTYLPVFQNLPNSTTTGLFDDFVLSRSARYVKITGHGNTENDWNAIEEFKLYTTKETLSNDIFDVVSNDDITLYPVPAKEVLSISGLTNNEANLEIYDISGVLVKAFTSNVSEINISNLNEGVYFLKITSVKSTSVKKFVVRK